jgi:hypothetical protein
MTDPERMDTTWASGTPTAKTDPMLLLWRADPYAQAERAAIQSVEREEEAWHRLRGGDKRRQESEL